jgi:hypothetical protein
MYSEISNPELFKSQVLTELGKSTGLNNTSRSSVLTQLVDAVSESMVNVSKYNASLINSTFTELASGDLLTDNAYEFGVLRNVYSDLYVKAEDQIVVLSTDDGNTFPKFSHGKLAIPKGKRYTIGNTTIEVLTDVYLQSDLYEIPLSIRVISSSTTDIKNGAVIDITDKKNINTSGLKIKFKEPVYNQLTEEDDNSLRSRTMSAKMKVHGSSIDSITGIVQYTPLVKVFFIDEDQSSGVVRVYIATDKTLKGEEDSSFPHIRSKLLNTFDAIGSAEQSFQILQPQILKVYPTFTYSNTTEVMALGAINQSFYSTYTPFSKIIDIDAIKTELTSYGLNVKIDALSLKSETYGTSESASSGVIEIPDGYVIYFSAADALGIEE